jgi:hypothetical protein
VCATANIVTCITSANCPSGEVCCGAGGSATGALGTVCLSACPANQRITCLAVTDCPTDAGVETCQSGGSVANNGLYETCRPPTPPADGGEAGVTEAGTSEGGADATSNDAAGGDAADAGGQ